MNCPERGTTGGYVCAQGRHERQHVLASPRESAHAKEHQAVSLAIERFHGVSTPAVEKAQSLACLQSRG